jgi:hypothetical protein
MNVAVMSALEAAFSAPSNAVGNYRAHLIAFISDNY